MNKFLSLKKDAFGLDISDLSLKIVQLKKGGESLGLASFGEMEIKPGLVAEGEVKDEEKLGKIIRTAISKVGGETLKTRYVIASLPEEKAFLQVIQLPLMDEKDLKSAVRFEAENHVPLPIEEVYLDFQVVPPLRDHLDHLDVLIAAQPKKIVDSYVNSLLKAGLLPKALEVESQAIARALVKNEASPHPILLIDLGAMRTSLIVFSGHTLRFTTSISVSAQKFSEAVSKALKLDLETAEKTKIKYGIGVAKNGELKEKAGDRKIFEAIFPILTDLMSQIKKCLSYHQTHASHEHLESNATKITKIFLCGGGANLNGLSEFISRELKIPVELGNPWVNILPKPLKEVPELPFEKSLGYTTALGLALRGIKEND